MSDQSRKYKHELKAIAEGLPFKDIELPDYKKKTFQPPMIRQERTYTRPDRQAEAISRFLAERGVVEILSNDQVIELFTEIYWCLYHIRRHARIKGRSTAQLRKAVTESRQLMSRVEAAEEELFIANRRLVVSCVKPFYWIGPVWLADFLQEGSKALTNAIRKFDFTRGVPFYSYAQKAIQNRLRNYFRDHVRSGSIGIRPTREMMLLKQAVDDWAQSHPKEVPPDTATLARLTGLSEQRVAKVRPFLNQWENMPAPPVSLDAMVGDTDTSLYSFVEAENADKAAAAAEKSEIWQAVDRLPPRARYIMHLRFIEGHTLEETGQKLSLTRARIKQIQDESLKKLRRMLKRGPGDAEAHL